MNTRIGFKNPLLVDDITFNKILTDKINDGFLESILDKILINKITKVGLDNYLNRILPYENAFEMFQTKILERICDHDLDKKKIDSLFKSKYEAEINKQISKQIINIPSYFKKICEELSNSKTKEIDNHIQTEGVKFKLVIENLIKDYNNKMKNNLGNYKKILDRDMFEEYNNINLHISALENYNYYIKQHEKKLENLVMEKIEKEDSILKKYNEILCVLDEKKKKISI